VKPPLLFLSPTAPTSTGHGLGMRAHAILRALAQRYRVFLLVLNHPPADAEARASLHALCAETAFLPIGLWNRRDARIRRIAARWPSAYRLLFPKPYEWDRIARTDVALPFQVREFEIAHVFRLYMAPLLNHLRAKASWRQCQLDLDDLESMTRGRLAAVYKASGDNAGATQLEMEARQYEQIEREHLHRFDRLFACSQSDQERIQKLGLHPSPEVLPNIMSIGNIPEATPHKGLQLLFVGNLGYAPNSDAVLHFCRDILPRIHAQIRRPVTFEIVGSGAPRTLKMALTNQPHARLLGWVNDLTPHYARADAVVVPLRAGGGTRIKILEAFAYQRPLVSTPEGIEGIAAVDGVHALIAQNADEFASACVRLLRDPVLCRQLTTRAFKLIQDQHSDKILANIL